MTTSISTPRYGLGARRLTGIAAVVVAVMAAACTGAGSPSDTSSTGDSGVESEASDPSTAIPEFDPADLPTVPAAVTVSGADPVSRAAELVAATSDDLADVSAGWLATYAEFGVPVVDLRAADQPDDPVGPRWSQVWSIGQASRGTVTIPLYDVATTLAAAVPSADAGDVLLADLRSASTNPDPTIQTLARFVAAKSVANGWTDPLDPAATPETVGLDAATVQLLAWVVLRDALILSVSAETASAAEPIIEGAAFTSDSEVVLVAAPVNPGTPAPKPCSESWGDSDTTSWTNFISNKLGGGIGVGGDGGPALPGVVEGVLRGLEKLSPELAPAVELSKRAAEFIGKANIISSVLSLMAQLNAVRLYVSLGGAEPLTRMKTREDGEDQDLDVELTYDFENLDINAPLTCGLVFLSNLIGVGLSIPANGAPISGAEILVDTGKNMPERIYFGRYDYRKLTTDQRGRATLNVLGHARKKEVPSSAKKKLDEYGIRFSAQVEEASLQSILNILLDGLSLNPNGAVSGGINIAKTFHYDFDEQFFPYYEWETDSYRVDSAPLWNAAYTFSGVVCDLDKPFTITMDGSTISAFVGSITFTPTSDTTMTYSFAGTFGPVTGQGSGTVIIDKTADNPTLLLDGGQWAADFPAPIGRIPVGPEGAHLLDVQSVSPVLLIPDENACQ